MTIRSHLHPALILTIAIAIGCGAPDRQADVADQSVKEEPTAYSLAGDPLFAPEPDSSLLAEVDKRRQAWEDAPTDADAMIWYGRFLAYAGQYDAAIELYSQGIEQHPDDPRFLRHRGHRYISIRQLDNAIADFERAASMIEGQPNEIEPDGMPNARGIPVSTLQGNIWYHLGLADYLKHDPENALRAFQNGLATAALPDNVVSTTHWIYMIHRRMGNDEAAEAALEPITPDMDIIENTAYHRLTLLYKGLIDESELAGDGSAGDAIMYGIGNWHLYNDRPEQAKQVFEQLLDEGNWASFGYIAAEADMLQYFQ